MIPYFMYGVQNAAVAILQCLYLSGHLPLVLVKNAEIAQVSAVTQGFMFEFSNIVFFSFSDNA